MKLNQVNDVQYIIEQNGDAFYLYSILKNQSGEQTKNYVRMSASKRDLERSIQELKLRKSV